MAALKRKSEPIADSEEAWEKKPKAMSMSFKKWGVEEVCDFLTQNELDAVIPLFKAEAISGSVLPDLTEEQLAKIGVACLGTRLTILQIIKHLQGKREEEEAQSNGFGTSLHLHLKVFNDPIHGHIELHPLCVCIIDTPQFQRLRYLKQLGGAYYVFPGATHNRFEHSIGVCYLAGRLVRELKDRQPELKITEQDILCVQIAGLCHDLGHGPYSHLWDGLFIPMVRQGIKWRHEDSSVKMFDYLVEDNDLKPIFEEYGLGERDRVFIKEQIAGPQERDVQQGWNYLGREEQKSFLYEVVANKRNGIDVDKWDYFERDCYHLGINSIFDHNRFIKFARVIRVDGHLQICSRDKEVGNLYDMFHTRNVLHRRAYQHKVNRIVEIMMAEAFAKADPHFDLEGRDGKTYHLSNAMEDVVAYTKLNDSLFHQILNSHNPNLAGARDILRNIEKRVLYKCVGQTVPKAELTITKKDTEVFAQEICDIMTPDDLEEAERPLRAEDFLLDVINLDYGMKKKNPIDNVRFYKKNNPEVAIRVRKDQVSQLLPETFAEQLLRIYCRRTDPGTLNATRKAFIKWCIKKDMPLPKGGDAVLELTPVRTLGCTQRPGTDDMTHKKNLQF